MNRRSFIESAYLNNSTAADSRCGEDQCECNEQTMNEKHHVKKTGLLRLSIVIVAVIISAGVLSVQTNVLNGTLILERAVIIPCGAAANKTGGIQDKKLPGDENNRKSCSHQQGALCETNHSKRKSLKIYNC
jgi:hypothetical protein